jgi:hypothetical protein
MLNRPQIIEGLRAEAQKLYPFNEVKAVVNPLAQIDSIEDNEAWIVHLYQKILGRAVDKYDTGVRHWLSQLKKQLINRQQMEQEFRKIAAHQSIEDGKKRMFESILEDKSKKILYVMPASERDLFLSSALFRSIKEQYPDYKLYVATSPQFFSVLDGDPYVDKVLNYCSEMDNLLFLEGNSLHKGYFDISFLPHVHSQRQITYIHNQSDKIAFGDCIKY